MQPLAAIGAFAPAGLTAFGRSRSKVFSKSAGEYLKVHSVTLTEAAAETKGEKVSS